MNKSIQNYFYKSVRISQSQSNLEGHVLIYAQQCVSKRWVSLLHRISAAPLSNERTRAQILLR